MDMPKGPFGNVHIAQSAIKTRPSLTRVAVCNSRRVVMLFLNAEPFVDRTIDLRTSGGWIPRGPIHAPIQPTRRIPGRAAEEADRWSTQNCGKYGKGPPW